MCIPKTPKMPAPPPTPELPQAPTEVDPSVLAARNRAKKQAAVQSGAASTVLTGGRGVISGANTADPAIMASKAGSKNALIGRKSPEEEARLAELKKKLTLGRSAGAGAGAKPPGGSVGSVIGGGSGVSPSVSTGGGFARTGFGLNRL